jgi:SAM-dependent methyltransferase
VRQSTGYGTEVCVDALHGASFARAIAYDALARKWPDRPPELPFDTRWGFGLFLTAGDERIGYVRAEAARVFPVQPLQGPEWEEYQFGAVVDFPLVAVSDDYAARCLDLLNAAVDVLSERYPPTVVYCLLPESAQPQLEILGRAGFSEQQRTCLDTEILTRQGFAGGEGRVVLYQKPTPSSETTPRPDPLRQLTRDPDDLRIFSNSQTKIRLQPTIEFWGEIQLYTTYSAYPFIPQFLMKLQEDFGLVPPERLLVAPTAGGDFLRLWPHASGVPSTALGLDIRNDLLRLAELRTEVPEIDLLNLVLCELLHQVVVRDGVLDATLTQELAELCRTMHATRKEPGMLRFDDPASLPLLARSFDEILQNRAIPDWFFPMKILASCDPSAAHTHTARADALASWLERRTPEIREAVAALKALAFDAQGVNIREKYHNTGLRQIARFRGADLTRDLTVSVGPYDLILCWEFIHVFHDQAALGQFIDTMLDRLAPNGRFVITNIREPSAERPPEQEWALAHLQATNVPFEPGFIRISGSNATGLVPFERRLHAHYPVVVARRRREGTQ